MNRLSKRLEKLESRGSTRLWNFDSAELLRRARSRLSDGDWAVLNEAVAVRGSGTLSERHQEAWKLWEQALSDAAEETRFPVRFTPDDVLICCGSFAI